MARNEIMIDAPPARVYDTLLDAGAYPKWVLGAKQVRGVDSNWPQRGSRFHHRVGIGPLQLADNTKLLDSTPDRRVVLEIRVRPLAKGVVTFDLKPKSRGRKTKVVMTENLTKGPLSWFRYPLMTAGIRARNAISLRKLRRLVASVRT